MELFLIRHAQSANNAKPVWERVCDPPITALGETQATHLAEAMIAANLTRLITSPFLRTLQTADAIRQTTGLAPHVRTQLHEQGGCYSGHHPRDFRGEPGMNRDEIQAKFPDFSIESELDGEGWWRSQPREGYMQARERAQALLQRTIDEFGASEERVGFVMHADIKMRLLECFHNESLDTPFNTSITKLRITNDDVQLIEFNQIDHLPSDCVSC